MCNIITDNNNERTVQHATEFCLNGHTRVSFLNQELGNVFFCFLTVAFIYQALKAQLEEKKPTLEDAQGLCDKLTDQNKDEPLVVAAIKNKLDKVESPHEDLRGKITELEGRLQAAQIRSQEFTVSFCDFKDKLQDMEELTANLQPVSAVYDTLKQQRSNDEVNRQTNTVQCCLL